jgi:hypothetical protein
MFSLLFACATTFGSVHSIVSPYDLPDTTVIIKFEQDSSYTKLISEEAYMTSTRTSNSESSKISVKGAACPIQIPGNKPFNAYFRIKSDVTDIRFCFFKMELKGNKRLATSSSTTGKKINKVKANIIQLDNVKKIYEMNIGATLTPGIYAFAFVTIENGHFRTTPFVSKSVYCIEITE